MSLEPRQVATRVKDRLKWEVRRRITQRRLAAPTPLPDVPPGEGGVVLFFTPEAGVVPHLAAQCILGRSLQERGHRVLFTRCFELYPRCPVMDMYALPYPPLAKVVEDVCLRCASSSFSMLTEYGLDAIDLRPFGTPEDKARARAAVADAPADLREFTFEGFPFGLLCGMDLALATKTSQFETVEPGIRTAWLQYIESSLLSYLMIDALCRAVPVRRIVHHNDYSLLLGGRLAAEKHGAVGYSTLHAGHRSVDRRYVLIRSEPAYAVLHKQGAAWPNWRDLPLSPAQTAEVAEDLLARFGGHGSHMFSPAKSVGTEDVRAEMGLPADKTLLVAYTSSLDESVAIRMTLKALGREFPDPPQPFPDQIAWLQALADRVGTRDDLYLVVRIHPREGVKKRAGVSQHLRRLRDAFDTPLPNVRIVWPDEPVSSYDLAEAADVALFSWSTIGSELARLGVPALASTHGISPFPQDDFLEWGATPAEYFTKLDGLLNRPASLETLARAFRWYHLFHLGTSVLLDDLVPDSNSGHLPPYSTPNAAGDIEAIIVGGQDILDLNHARQVSAQTLMSAAEEQAALRRQVRRLLHFLYTGRQDGGDGPLEVVLAPDGLDMPGPDAGARLMISGSRTVYQLGGENYVRISPLCARLGPLGTEPPT